MAYDIGNSSIFRDCGFKTALDNLYAHAQQVANKDSVNDEDIQVYNRLTKKLVTETPEHMKQAVYNHYTWNVIFSYATSIRQIPPARSFDELNPAQKKGFFINLSSQNTQTQFKHHLRVMEWQHLNDNI